MVIVEGSFMFLASSPPKDRSHWYCVLRESKSPIYKDYPLEKTCRECQNTLPIEEWQNCTHQKIRNGLNKDDNKRKAMTDLNPNKEGGIRENYGILVDDELCAFDVKSVNRIFEPKQKMYFDIKKINNIIVCFDPAYNGNNMYAASASALVDGVHTLLFVDFAKCPHGPDQLRFLKETLYYVSTTFRADKTTQSIVIAIEANSRSDGEMLRILLTEQTDDHYANMHVIRDEQHNKGNGFAGVRLDKYRKPQMTEHLGLLLDSNKFKLHYKLATRNEKGVQTVLDEFKNQLTRFRGSDHSGKKGSGNDDVVRTALMCVYWWCRFFGNKLYAPQRREAGIN